MLKKKNLYILNKNQILLNGSVLESKVFLTKKVSILKISFSLLKFSFWKKIFNNKFKKKKHNLYI